MILKKSEGNPFFIEEVIRSLIDRDLVYRQDDRWKARREIENIDVPDTIQSMLLSRVDRLEDETKYVLQCASVIGRLFRYRLLEHLAQRERALKVTCRSTSRRVMTCGKIGIMPPVCCEQFRAILSLRRRFPMALKAKSWAGCSCGKMRGTSLGLMWQPVVHGMKAVACGMKAVSIMERTRLAILSTRGFIHSRQRKPGCGWGEREIGSLDM
jgi:hypothetical protein